MQLSIVIVNYNVKYFLEHCLLSTIQACKNIEAEIFVVDNNSTDGSKAYLEPLFPTVKFVWNSVNLGFGKANNSVLGLTKGKHILFLNPDTIVPEDCFTNCISFFETHTNCGAIGVRMVDGSGQFLKESKRSLPTPSAGFFKMVGLAKLFPTSKIFAQYYAGNVKEKENKTVAVLAGAFMMLSKKAIELTQGFDEDFFMYGEDIDLSYRIQKAGLQNYYLGQTTIVHFKGESSQKKSATYVEHFYGAIKRFVHKHYSNHKVTLCLMTIVINSGKYFAIANRHFTKNNTILKIAAKLNCIYFGNDDAAKTINEKIKGGQNKIVTAINSTENLFSIVEKSNTNAVIFSNDYQSNKKNIEALQHLPSNQLALFYQKNAKSIIGSNNKNENGIIISMD